MHMLCRNKLADYDRCYKVFASHKSAHEAAGLILEHTWRESDDANTVWFLFRVDDLDKANAFVSAPQAGDAAEEAGVIDGEYHYLDSAS